MGWELKKLRDKNLDSAINLAKHYRDLNQPEEAESICRDVLEIAPTNVDALRTLGLALTDRFASAWMSLLEEACATFKKLPGDYERAYYAGIAWERRAKAQLESGRTHTPCTRSSRRSSTSVGRRRSRPRTTRRFSTTINASAPSRSSPS